MINKGPLSPPPSTVGRGKRAQPTLLADATYRNPAIFASGQTALYHNDFLNVYKSWPDPTVIISDGAYGVLGFDGDTADASRLTDWYSPHISAWSKKATPQTTLWVWNTEVGWATLHPLLTEHGWKYVGLNIWDKGKAHIAGKNTTKLKRFPVVTEVCAQYVREATIQGLTVKEWLLFEWKRTGLPLYEANIAAGVKSAATRKYFDQGHLWYPPPPEAFIKLVHYANLKGDPAGRPYYSLNGKRPATKEEWLKLFPKFNPIHGYTNVWKRPALKGKERVSLDKNGAAAHLNQKPLDLMRLLIEASSDPGDVVWEPFGGLFTGTLAAYLTSRKGFGSEIDRDYYLMGIHRIQSALVGSSTARPLPQQPFLYGERNE